MTLNRVISYCAAILIALTAACRPIFNDRQFFGHLKSYASYSNCLTADRAPDEVLAQSPPSVRLTAMLLIRWKISWFYLSINSTGGRILLIAESIGRREIIYEYLQDHGLSLGSVKAMLNSIAATAHSCSVQDR